MPSFKINGTYPRRPEIFATVCHNPKSVRLLAIDIREWIRKKRTGERNHGVSVEPVDVPPVNVVIVGNVGELVSWCRTQTWIKEVEEAEEWEQFLIPPPPASVLGLLATHPEEFTVVRTTPGLIARVVLFVDSTPKHLNKRFQPLSAEDNKKIDSAYKSETLENAKEAGILWAYEIVSYPHNNAPQQVVADMLINFNERIEGNEVPWGGKPRAVSSR